MNKSYIKLCCDAADGQIKTGTNVSSLPWRHTAQNCLLVILGEVRAHTHPRDFSRRLAGEPTISPRVQWTCPRKSCIGGRGHDGWRETKFWGKGRGSLGVSGRVTKSSGEELINVKSIVRLEIRTCEADTYVKVGWLPGWRRRRKREERKTGQQQWHNRAYHGTEGRRLKYQTVINPVQEKRSRYEEEQIGRVATAPRGGRTRKKEGERAWQMESNEQQASHRENSEFWTGSSRQETMMAAPRPGAWQVERVGCMQTESGNLFFIRVWMMWNYENTAHSP